MRHLLGEKITQPWSVTLVRVCKSQPESAKTGPTGFPGPLTFYPVSMGSLYPTTWPLCKWLRGHKLTVLTLLFILTAIFTLTLTCVCYIIVTISPLIFWDFQIPYMEDTFIYHYQWVFSPLIHVFIDFLLVSGLLKSEIEQNSTWHCCSYRCVCTTGCRLN